MLVQFLTQDHVSVRNIVTKNGPRSIVSAASIDIWLDGTATEGKFEGISLLGDLSRNRIDVHKYKLGKPVAEKKLELLTI